MTQTNPERKPLFTHLNGKPRRELFGHLTTPERHLVQAEIKLREPADPKAQPILDLIKQARNLLADYLEQNPTAHTVPDLRPPRSAPILMNSLTITPEGNTIEHPTQLLERDPQTGELILRTPDGNPVPPWEALRQKYHNTPKTPPTTHDPKDKSIILATGAPTVPPDHPDFLLTVHGRHYQDAVNRFRLQQRYQDSGWSFHDRSSYTSLHEAYRKAKSQAAQAIHYGMVRIIDDHQNRVVVTFPAGCPDQPNWETIRARNP